MLVHNVLFWIKKRLDGPELTEFRMGLESLKHIEHARAVFIGTPADVPDRPVIQKGYDYCLTVVFKDLAAHDAYQADPVHQAFIENHKDKFRRVRVIDAAD